MMKVAASSTMLLASVGFLGYIVAVNGAVMMTSTSLDVRRLQTNQTSNFRATYRADFQLLRDFVCTTEPPLLQITCYGTEMTLLNVSDASILCVALDEASVKNGTTYQCANTCTTCASVYEASGDIQDGPFGSVDFMCEGDKVEQVDAIYVYMSGNDGSCSVASSGQSRNYHVGRLGVLCSTESTGSSAYVYDDTYVECQFNNADAVGFAVDTAEKNSDDIYTCITGKNCEGQQCVIPFDEMRFFATLPNFLNCVESTVGTPTIIPQVPESASQMYNVQFEASWAQLFEPVTSQSSCSSVNPSVLIKCGTGASIQLVNATDASMLCSRLSSSELSCSGDANAIKNNFTSVVYTCGGNTLPATQVFYPESSATCANNAVEVTVRHSVGLGVLCQDPSTAEVFYTRLDRNFECADAEHNFNVAAFGDTVRYTCGESATFVVGSTSSQPVRNVTVTTDEVWLTDPDGCYNLAVTPPTLLIPSPPTALPTTFPTAYPTTAPSAIVVSVSPTVGKLAITQAPIVVQAPTVAEPIVPPVSGPDDGGDSTVGIAIGAAVGGIAIAAVIGFFLFYSLRSKASNESKPSNVSTYSESNTDDDYASSRSPTSLSGPMGNSVLASVVQPSPSRQAPAPFHPTTAAPSGKRDVYVPDLNMPMRSDISPQTASSSSQRSSYPTNHVVDVKDQCRSVAMVQPLSPRFVSQADSNVPFAVALGVSTTIASESSGTSSKREPSGRNAMDA